MLRLMEARHYDLLFNLNLKYVNNASSTQNESEISLELLFYMCSAIINDDIYPTDWSDLLLLRNK